MILDSCCGTGRSSRSLAQDHGAALIIGIDQSGARLARGQRADPLPDNLLLVRAECADFWRLAVDQGWQLARHCLFYPNPWPKAAHLKRRWHGHPVFPALLALGGTLEVRSNWLIYLEEMRSALALAGREVTLAALPGGNPPLTDFERKYRDSGHPLYQLTSNLQV